MSGPTRAPDGATISFSFDGLALKAHHGDTLAAALLANGIGLVGRSFKYHRPRGIMAAGVEEPNALVTVGEGEREEPNTRATDVFVYDGLVARSQNRWPSLNFDVGAALGLLSKVLPAGFYYKTFFGPAKLWLVYEWFIRRAAGLGKAPTLADPDRFAQRAAFCDVLVVGAGHAGLQAAVEAAEAGQKVILVEQDAVLGGALLRDRDPHDLGPQWIDEMAARVRAAGGTILTRTCASGYWEHDLVTLTQRCAEPGQLPPSGPTQRLWHVRAGQVILATGCIERPIAFADNDRPGVMLSQAVRTYITRFGVVPGQRVVIATNNDDAYLTAQALQQAGATVVAILDARPAPAGAGLSHGLPHFNNAIPTGVKGKRHHLRNVMAEIDGSSIRWSADLLATSGGFTPVAHLHMQAGGTLNFDVDAQAFVPAASRQNVTTIGSAANPLHAPAIPAAGNPKKSFIDFQNDVTLADVDLAWAEGYRSVEHLKRYTTLGMATDQGKTSNMAALARLAERQGVAIPDAGLTTFRPPYAPVTMGLLAGRQHRDAGAHLRRLALWDEHSGKNPIWQPVGYWKRPRAFPRGNEDLAASALREAQTVRTAVGMTDVSTLAKFEVSGPDAALFLEKICATTVAKLAVGRGRYTFMLREDGLVFDDGTVWRLAEDRYLLTSSTGGADRMATHISYVRQVLHPELRVSAVNVQEHFAGIAVAGPQAKAVIAALTGSDAPRHMSCGRATIAGTPVLLLGASYSGERAFEVYVEATLARGVWLACEAEVSALRGCTYGLEAMEILRIEKGHIVVGGEVDGRRSPHDLGLASMLNKAGGFVGAAGLSRPAFNGAGRLQMVGLASIEGPIPEGAMLVKAKGLEAQGHVTAAAYRVLEGKPIALAMLQDGATRHGEVMLTWSPTRNQSAHVRVVAPHFYDPAGERYRE
jgi:methylglutamate dehydrogenase subunit C